MRSRKAVEAVLKHQGKAGADLGIALGSIGTGLEGSTTTNLAADIFAFSDAKGLFGGFPSKERPSYVGTISTENIMAPT